MTLATSLDDIGAVVGIIAGLLAIGAGTWGLLWKLFRKLDQMDDTSTTAAAAAQAVALIDRRLLDVQHEVTANGGGSLKDDVREIRDSLPKIIEKNNEARDASFLEMAEPYVSRFEAHDAQLTAQGERLVLLEEGHAEILAMLNRLIDNMKETHP